MLCGPAYPQGDPFPTTSSTTRLVFIRTFRHQPGRSKKKSQGRDLEAPPRWMETRPSLDLADFQPLPIQRLAFHATSPHSSPPGAAPNTATTCALDLEPQRLAFHATSPPLLATRRCSQYSHLCALDLQPQRLAFHATSPRAPRQGPLLSIPPIQSGARRFAPRGGGS